MEEPSFLRGGHGHGRRGLEGLAHALHRVLEHALDAEAMAGRGGLLQGLDPRFKLLALLALIAGVLFATSLAGLTALFALALLLALASHIGLARLAGQVWIGVLLFTGAIALPALVTVPGETLARLPLVEWAVTRQGLRSAAFLVGRAEVSATFALLLILTTPWPHLLKALRSLGVPVVLVAILGMTYRYLFVLLQSALQMFEARRSRIVGPMSRAEQRRSAVAAAGALLGRAFQLSGEVHLAMIARGYRGEVHLLDDFHARPRDWLALAAGLAVPALILRGGW